MKFNSIITVFILSIVISSFAFANNGIDKIKTKAELNEGPKTIVGVAASNENFTTLVAAVKAAELIDVLNGDGPFTVFAPTNEAFAKLPEGTVSNLLKKENKEFLNSILTYHVVVGNFTATDVVTAIKKNKGKFVIPTVQGGTLTASISNGNVILTDMNGNSSTVIITDVKASNGVIHAIDSVVMPN
jgi:uncharacterized surface protein with fasciclin (FAS1) repeats